MWDVLSSLAPLPANNVRANTKYMQLLQEQVLSLREQERLMHRRLVQERADDLAAAEEAREKNREAIRQENHQG